MPDLTIERTLQEIVSETLTTNLRIPSASEPFNKDFIKLGSVDNINHVYSSLKKFIKDAQGILKQYQEKLPIEHKKILFDEYTYFLSGKLKDFKLKEGFINSLEGFWQDYERIHESRLSFESFVSYPINAFISVILRDQADKFEKSVMSSPERCGLRDKTVFLLTLYEFCSIENDYTDNESFKKYIINETDENIIKLIENGSIKVNDEPIN